MSRLTLFLLLSGVANVGAVFALLNPRTAALAAPDTSAAASPVAPAAPPSPPIGTPLDEHTWADLQSATDAQAAAALTPAYVARLRAEGFPADVIRAILARQIDDAMKPRADAIQASHPLPNFWETSFRNYNSTTPAARLELLALTTERKALLRDLLGADAESPNERARRIAQFGNIDPLKADQAQALLLASSIREGEFRSSIPGPTLPADRDARIQLQAERDAALAALLTPEELASYQIRSSSTASSLRFKLQSFAPTETEFLTVYAVQSEFDAQFANRPSTLSTDERRAWDQARNTAQATLDADLAAALGPDRYAEYQLKTSSTYRQASYFTTQQGLAETVTATLSSAQTATETEARQLRSDRSLSNDERNARLTALQTKARQQLATTLTPEQLTAYEQQTGSWIKRLVPTPRPTTGGN